MSTLPPARLARSAAAILLPLVLGAALIPGACGGPMAEGNGASTSPGTDILLRDAPADDLLAFRGTIVDVRLDDDLGGQTPNLLASGVVQEFLSLQSSFAWLSNRQLTPGNYTAVRITFLAGSLSARRNDGVDVAVNGVSNVLVTPFDAPLVVDGTTYARVVVDLDLTRSLSGSIASPPLQFDPQGSVVIDGGSPQAPIDEVRGTAVSVDANANTFLIDAFVDDDGAVLLGPVTVSISLGTVLVEDDGTLFPAQSLFFGSLVPGATHVEVHGGHLNGRIEATRVEIENNGAGGGNANLVKIRGRILDLGPATELEMSIAEIDDGAAIASAAFGGTIPETFHVHWDAGTVFFLEEQAETTSATLAIGQSIHVKFPVFTNPPFLASRIQIENEDVEFEGHVTSVAGLPTDFAVHLEPDDPAVLSGEVADTSTNVSVDIIGATIFLDVHAKPPLPFTAVLTGEKVQPEGTLSGPPTGPTIHATKVKVFAGRLDDASVPAADRANHAFHATGGTLGDPFGGGVVAGDIEVLLAAGAVFTGDATTETAFFDLFDGLQVGETLVVEVRGIGTGTPTSVQGYEIDAQVQD